MMTVKNLGERFQKKKEKYILNREIIRISNTREENNTKLIGEGQKILFGYSFNIYEPCKIHDFLLAKSLQLRGATISALACNGLQELQCSFYGGEWSGYNNDSKHDKNLHDKHCRSCKKNDTEMWNKWMHIEPVKASEMLSESDKNEIKDFINKLDISNYKDWQYKGINIGEKAFDVYRNNLLIATVEMDDNIKEKLSASSYNVALMVEATSRAVKKIKPDIIYSNDSFYYPFSILECVAKNEGIPFYNGYGFGRKNCWSYAFNESVMSINLDKAWNSYKLKHLDKQIYDFISEYLENRKSGSDMLLNTADPSQNSSNLSNREILNGVTFDRKTALLASNVAWDLAALNKDIQFENMFDWVIKTAQFFEDNKQWQLVIRVHPGETNMHIPETKEKVADALLKFYGNELPDNIILIDSNDPVSTYDLLPFVDIGLVYTSTLGIEMAAKGIPVVTSGKSPYINKGFTFDTQNQEDYFVMIEDILERGIDERRKNENIELAKKFFYLYYFNYIIDINLFEYSMFGPVNLKIKSGDSLKPGHNKTWDYICESIIKGLPIFDENRIPPKEIKI